MADDSLSAVLAEIGEDIAAAPTAPPTSTIGRLATTAERLAAAVETALKFHERVPLYGNAATDDKPDACPHDPDSPLHFEADDGSGEWLCEGRPEGAVCSTCIDGEGGGRVEWPCPEYEAIRKELTGEGDDSGK